MTPSPAVAVRVDRGHGVARVTVGSGHRGNALGTTDWSEIERVCRALGTDAEVRVVIVDGAGGMFCAGSNIRDWAAATPDGVVTSFERMERACAAVEELPIPVIAQVRGAAAGAGCQLALACDLRIMADTATMGMPIARLGILVTPAFAARLSSTAGVDTARELLFTGRMIGADEAVRRGLATRSAPGERLDEVVDELVDRVLSQSAAAVRGAKRAVNANLASARAAAAARVTGPPVDEDDFRAGVRAFLRRRDQTLQPRRSARTADSEEKSA